MDRRQFTLLACAVAGLGVGALVLRRRGESPAEAPRREPESETTLMTRLRDMGPSDPSMTLQLARQGERQFRDSADAAERSRMIVKALMELGRADEARAEARVMVEKYRGTSWAADVYRHMLVNPSPDPSERRRTEP